MAAQRVETSDRAARISLSFLQDLLADYPGRDFAVRLWDGSTWEPDVGQPTRFTLVLRHPGALKKMFLPPTELALAEAYLYDDFDIEGDIESIFGLADHVLGQDWSLGDKVRYAKELLALPGGARARAGRQASRLDGARHSRERDRQAISYHYDVSNEFYALWLDRHMVYSCAYFHTPDDDIDTAQERKLDYICRKLGLRPGDRLLDIGCGWGGLVMHAARHYGAQALGITLSQPQVDLANERIRRAGLEDRCRVELRDYRAVEASEGYDKLVSVGMFEHVGEEKLPEYFELAYGLLRPGGLFLNHGIARRIDAPATSGPTFSDRYVFPDGELVPISTTTRVAEEVGFEVRDVESLREHYALTLRQWVRRLESNRERARQCVDEVTYRVWRLFMSGSAHGFSVGRLNVYQTLLSRPDQGDSQLSLTREDWYR